MLDEIFQRKKVIPQKLLSYGFRQEKNDYMFGTDILQGSFHLEIRLCESNSIDTTLVEAETDEEYIHGVKVHFFTT